MMILSFFPSLSFWHKVLIDSVLLIPLFSPVLYFFLIRLFLEHSAEGIQAEETLAQTKEKLNSILKSVPDIIYRLDTEGRITFVNDSTNQYGNRPEGLIGRPIWNPYGTLFIQKTDEKPLFESMNDALVIDAQKHTKYGC
jgi:PAS domain-containing protein